VQDSHPRAPLDVLDVAPEDARASAPLAAVETSYVCSVCASPWPYQAVRNTGRCPACGSGLRRAAE